MKSLKRYIMEELNASTSGPKDISINFADLEEAKDHKESLKQLLEQQEITYTENGETISFTITADALDKAKLIYDQLKDFSNKLRTSMKRTNNEQYAQKTLTFEKSVEEINNYIEEVNQTAAANKEAEERQAEQEKEKEEQEKAEQEQAKQMNTNVNSKQKIKNQKTKKEEE